MRAAKVLERAFVARLRLELSEEEAWELARETCPNEELRWRLLEESRRSSVARFWGAFLREFPEFVGFCHASEVPGLPPRAGRVARVEGGGGSSIATAVLGASPLGRYRLGASFAGGAGGFRRLDTVAQFAQAFRDLGRFEPPQLDALLEDLEGSHANLFLGLCLREGWRRGFAGPYRALIEGTGKADDDLLSRCEAWCALGHPFHPTPKCTWDRICHLQVPSATLARRDPPGRRGWPVN